MAHIKIKDEEWTKVNTKSKSDVASRKKCSWEEGHLRYSPTGRYAAFKLSHPKGLRYNFYVVNMFNKEIRRYRLDGEKYLSCDTFFFYWLNEVEIMLFMCTGRKTQRQYLCRIDHFKGQLQTITTHFEKVADNNIYTSNDIIRFVLNQQDFLVIHSFSAIYLKPYRLLSNTENQQPTIIVKYPNNWIFTEQNVSIVDFGYKNKLYYFIQYNYRKYLLDEFFCVNLTEKKAVNGIITLQREDSSIFTPRKLSSGTFRTDKCLSAWQEGKMVVLMETHPCYRERANGDLGERFWILDLEKETILERLVESTRLKRATLYQEDFIMLWNLPYANDNPKIPPTKIKYKQILRTDIVPRLKSICSAKLLSQKGIEKNRVAERFMYQ